jgi:hypothetical protein
MEGEDLMDKSAAAKIMMADNNGGTAPSGLQTLSITHNNVDKKASEESVVGWNAINLAIPVGSMKAAHNNITIKANEVPVNNGNSQQDQNEQQVNLEAFVSAEADLSLNRVYITDTLPYIALPYAERKARAEAAQNAQNEGEEESDPEPSQYHEIECEGFGSAYVNIVGEAKYVTQNGAIHSTNEDIGFTRIIVNVPSTDDDWKEIDDEIAEKKPELQRLQEECRERQRRANQIAKDWTTYFPTTGDYQALCNVARDKTTNVAADWNVGVNYTVSTVYDLTDRKFVAPAYCDEGDQRGRYLKLYLYNMDSSTNGTVIGTIDVGESYYNSTGNYSPVTYDEYYGDYDGSGKDCQVRLRDFRVTDPGTGAWTATATVYRVSNGNVLRNITVSGQTSSLLHFGADGHRFGISDALSYNYKPPNFS